MFEFEINKVYNGDCKDVMLQFPENSIACCIYRPTIQL